MTVNTDASAWGKSLEELRVALDSSASSAQLLNIALLLMILSTHNNGRADREQELAFADWARKVNIRQIKEAHKPTTGQIACIVSQFFLGALALGGGIGPSLIPSLNKYAEAGRAIAQSTSAFSGGTQSVSTALSSSQQAQQAVASHNMQDTQRHMHERSQAKQEQQRSEQHAEEEFDRAERSRHEALLAFTR